MKSIAVVSVARSDYGILTPVMRGISEHPDLALQLVVAGMHLDEAQGRTIDQIRRDGWTIAETVEMTPASDSGRAVADAIGRGIAGFARAFQRFSPDLVVLLGDRFETLAAATAALPLRLPVAHIHGGEATFGALDDAFRHAITKMSHLHFAATREYAQRIIQMGEEEWRVTVSGAPGLDNIADTPFLSLKELAEHLCIPLPSPPVLVTFHPETAGETAAEQQLDALLGALSEVALPVVFTAANSDAGGRYIAARIDQFVRQSPASYFAASLGTQAYFSLLKHAAVMVGNSSSGIIEAPSFGLPVVNIGTRQEGRVRASNVIDVGHKRREIADAIRQAVSPGFSEALEGLSNPYGEGNAAPVIVDRLAEVSLGHRLLMKRFIDTER